MQYNAMMQFCYPERLRMSKPVQPSLFYDCRHRLWPNALGSAVKPVEEEGHLCLNITEKWTFYSIRLKQ